MSFSTPMIGVGLDMGIAALMSVFASECQEKLLSD